MDNSGFESRQEQDIFPRLQKIRSSSWAQPAYYSLGTGVTSRGLSQRQVKLTTLIHLLPRLRMSGTIPLHPLYVFMGLSLTTSSLPYIHNNENADSRNQMFSTSNINTNIGHCTKLVASISSFYNSPPKHPVKWSIPITLFCVPSVLFHNACQSSCCLHSFRITYKL